MGCSLVANNSKTKNEKIINMIFHSIQHKDDHFWGGGVCKSLVAKWLKCAYRIIHICVCFEAVPTNYYLKWHLYGRRIVTTRRFVACNRTKNASYLQKLPWFSIQYQKLFNFPCFKRVSDVYLIRYIYKHCNTTSCVYIGMSYWTVPPLLSLHWPKKKSTE